MSPVTRTMSGLSGSGWPVVTLATDWIRRGPVDATQRGCFNQLRALGLMVRAADIDGNSAAPAQGAEA